VRSDRDHVAPRFDRFTVQWHRLEEASSDVPVRCRGQHAIQPRGLDHAGNVGYSIVGSSDAPYFNELASRCGLATNDDAVSHPSLPNYIALTSGSTQGITDDDEPSSHPLKSPSIFSELGSNWRALVESMPQPVITSRLVSTPRGTIPPSITRQLRRRVGEMTFR